MYKAAGRVIAYMMAIGTVLPKVFSPFLYALVAFGPRKVRPQLHDLQDYKLQLQLFRVSSIFDEKLEVKCFNVVADRFMVLKMCKEAFPVHFFPNLFLKFIHSNC